MLSRGQRDADTRMPTIPRASTSRSSGGLRLHRRARVADCDVGADHYGIRTSSTFDVPTLHADPDGSGPASRSPPESVLVVLEAKDDLGAAAKPAQQLILPRSMPPDARRRSRSAVTARRRHAGRSSSPPYSDPDDGPPRRHVTWQVFAPSRRSRYTLTDLVVPQTGGPGRSARSAQKFVPTRPATVGRSTSPRDRSGRPAATRTSASPGQRRPTAVPGAVSADRPRRRRHAADHRADAVPGPGRRRRSRSVTRREPGESRARRAPRRSRGRSRARRARRARWSTAHRQQRRARSGELHAGRHGRAARRDLRSQTRASDLVRPEAIGTCSVISSRRASSARRGRWRSDEAR